MVHRDRHETNQFRRYITKTWFDSWWSSASNDYQYKRTKPRQLPQGFRIETVQDRSKLRIFFDVWIVSYPFLQQLGDIYYNIFTIKDFKLDYPNKFYIGYLDGKPVLTSRVFYGKEFESLYWVSSHPLARGRGIATTMTINPLRDSQSYGYKMVFLFAIKMGSYIYPKNRVQGKLQTRSICLVTRVMKLFFHRIN